MDSQFEEFKLSYMKYCVNIPIHLREELIILSAPDENDAHNNAVIRGYVLLSRWKPKDNAQMKILTTYDKLLKKNQEQGRRLTPKNFSYILYLLHRFCVRLMKNPWRKEYFVIKDYNGFYQYTLASHLSSSVIKDLLQVMGFEYDESSHTFNLKWPSMNAEASNHILNSGIGLFLSYIHCRARNDANFKERVKGLTYLLQRPGSRDGVDRSRRTTEHTEYGIAKNDSRINARHNLNLRRPSAAKAITLERSYNIDTSGVFRSAMPKPSTARAQTIESRIPHDYDLYGPDSANIYEADPSTSRNYGQRLDPKLKDGQFNDVTMPRSSRDKRLAHSEPSYVSDAYVQFMPIERSSVVRRGSPDGGTDVDKDFAERHLTRSDHVYHHIK